VGHPVGSDDTKDGAESVVKFMHFQLVKNVIGVQLGVVRDKFACSSC
jgi:hypothetical protein